MPSGSSTEVFAHHNAPEGERMDMDCRQVFHGIYQNFEMRAKFPIWNLELID